MMEFIGGLIGWVVIAGCAFYLLNNVVDVVKKVVARKRAKGDDKNDEKECDNSN